MPNGKFRIADMVVEHPLQGTIYYEFKSVKNLPPNDFVEQFSKDLSYDNFSVDNLRWIFDGRKTSCQDLEVLISEIEKVLQKNTPQMPKQKRDKVAQRLLHDIFIVM